jgi:hypothetical protein
MNSDSGSSGGQGDDLDRGLPALMTALLSSRVRYKLLARFLAGQDTPRHARQLAKDTGEHFNAVWQELKHLQSLGILASEKAGNQVRYCTDPAFPLLPELRRLIRKAEGQTADPGTATAAPAERRSPELPPQLAVATRPRRAAESAAQFIIGEVD